MMLCKADFEQLFPESFAPEQMIETETFDLGPSAACIARWEDDGGLTLAEFASDQPPARTSSRLAIAMSDPTRAGLAFVATSAAATYGVAWSLLATYDQMMDVREIDA